MLMNDRLLSALGPYTMYQRSSDALCVQRFLPVRPYLDPPVVGEGSEEEAVNFF